MLLNNAEVYVYKLDDEGTFDAIGEINQFTSLMWPDKYNGYSTFSLWAPITEENKSLIKKGNIIWLGGRNAAMIEIIKLATDADGQKTYEVKGRTLEMLLTTRVIWNTYNCNNKYASTAMYEIVTQQCVSPTNIKRKIPFLVCAEDEQLGGKITYQRTGDEVYDAVYGICSERGLGFDIVFDPENKQLVFTVTEGKDRTVSQSINNPVILSTSLEDILKSSYYTNDQELKSVALIAGEGSGTDRKRTTSGDNDSEGFGRRELYVDARDLQTEIVNEDGTITIVPEEEYLEMLVNRGNEKLSDCETTETFEAKARVTGSVQYAYGVDYSKGDKITVEDEELGIRVEATVDESSENYDDEYELILTLGYSYPTLIQRIKRQLA